tara:strand:+ start:1344 stop:1517 length:174 start_codon:yes stop_codon:yes gene_type:complete
MEGVLGVLTADEVPGLVSLLIEKDGISSQLIDNVNASIHLRALLTDLFIIDEILRSK